MNNPLKDSIFSDLKLFQLTNLVYDVAFWHRQSFALRFMKKWKKLKSLKRKKIKLEI